MSSPTGTHDGNRLANLKRGDAEQLKVAMTFFLTLSGIPFIYYGDEIGMKFIEGMPDIEGSRTRSGSRTPMQWDSNLNAGFSTAQADKIYIPLDPDPKRPTVASEDKDPNSLLNYVRSLLNLRASSVAIGNTGGWKLISNVDKPYPMVFMRWEMMKNISSQSIPPTRKQRQQLLHKESQSSSHHREHIRKAVTV